MAFEPKKFTELYEAMRNSTSSLTDFEVGSVTRTMYESFAYELGLLYQKMNLFYLSAFVDSAEGTHLEQVVAVLGIQRSLPDFAVGEVIFLRDKGNADINIPAGTLVATEDTPELPKKVYQTIDAVVLAKDQAEVTANVQAINRGEDQDTDTDTVVVMPRPIPGVKSVNNPQAVKLVGRRRETDDELRRRAKNALLSSGKANIAALENAVLSLPEVLDVKVQEDFRYAKGIITITPREDGTVGDIPKGSAVITDDDQSLKYLLVQEVSFNSDSTPKEVQIISETEGKKGELSTEQHLKFLDSGLDSKYSIDINGKIEQSQFGMVQVIVDTPNFDENKEGIVAAVDAVRAAGVFVTVSGAQKVQVYGVFRIAPAAQLSLESGEDRQAFEEKISQAIVEFFQSVKMGQPLLLSKMMKAILSVDGVDDLSEFHLFTPVSGGTNSRELKLENNKLTAGELERFYPERVCVATEDKPLVFNISFKDSRLTTQDQLDTATGKLKAYFKGVSLGGTIEKTKIIEAITSPLGGEPPPEKLKVLPVSWCPNPWKVISPTDASYKAEFVERPELGTLFGYNQEVQLGGALLLVLSGNVKDSDKETIRNEARNNIAAYLDSLAQEEDVVIETLLDEVKKDKHVSDVKFSEDDVVVTIDPAPDVAEANPLNNGKIDVKALQKAVLAPATVSDGDPAGSSPFVIATEITNLEITVTVEISISQPPLPEPQANEDTIKSQVAHTIKSFVTGYIPGQDLAYNDLKSHILNLSFGFSFTLDELKLETNSIAGFRKQEASAAAPQDILVREIELAFMMPPIVNITIVPITPGP